MYIYIKIVVGKLGQLISETARVNRPGTELKKSGGVLRGNLDAQSIDKIPKIPKMFFFFLT